MQNIKKMFIPSPGDRNETGNTGNAGKRNDKKEDEEINEKSEKSEGKSKLDEALQQWSNDDARDRAIDDSSPLRSGL